MMKTKENYDETVGPPPLQRSPRPRLLIPDGPRLAKKLKVHVLRLLLSVRAVVRRLPLAPAPRPPSLSPGPTPRGGVRKPGGETPVPFLGHPGAPKRETDLGPLTEVQGRGTD